MTFLDPQFLWMLYAFNVDCIESRMMGNILGVFAKEPVPGKVKTRLAAESSPEFA
jgi:hypothetical protein